MKKIHQNTMRNNKVSFIHHLRGVAALLVVMTHYLKDLWTNPYQMHKVLTNIDWEIPFYAKFLDKFASNIGPIIVSMFFIISGYVITISIERYSILTFINKRFRRLFPVYFCSLIISFFFIYCYYKFNGIMFPFAMENLLYHFTMIPALFGYHYLDIVTWTLQCELIFYFTCLILYYFIKNGKYYYIIGFLIIKGAFFWHLRNSAIENISDLNFYSTVHSYSMHFYFMFIGMFIYFYNNKKLNIFVMIICIFSMLSYMFYLREFFYKGIFSSSSNLASVIIPVFVFVILHILSNKNMYILPCFVEKTLNKLANVSYSLYLAHCVPGMVIISFCYPNIALGLTLSIFYTIIATYFLHKIEKISS